MAKTSPLVHLHDPELAHVGLTIAEARDRYGERVDVSRPTWLTLIGPELTARPRRHCVVSARGRVVGAHILAPAAGEMIHELALAVRRKMKLTDLASLVHVYPTLSTGIGQVAAQSAFDKARRLRWLVRKWR